MNKTIRLLMEEKPKSFSCHEYIGNASFIASACNSRRDL